MIYITGDTHGNIKRFSSSNFPEGKELSKNDVVIQLGDFGILWNPPYSDEEVYWMMWLAKKPWTTLVVPGNHENHDTIESLPITEKWGGKVYEYFSDVAIDSIYFAIPGEIYTIENKTFLAIPKALSIDKEYRVEGKSWWRNELLSIQEENNVLDNLDKMNWEVDYVISHTAPEDVLYQVVENIFHDSKYKDPVSKFLYHISKTLKFKWWGFGHFHKDINFEHIGNKYSCFYYTLCSLDEILEENYER